MLRGSFSHVDQRFAAMIESCTAGAQLVEADVLGIDANTLLRWLEISDFQEVYRKARRETVQQAVARLQQATGNRSLTMLKMMTDPNIPGAVRLRAAAYVFDYAIKGIEVDDTEARLAALESAPQINPRR